MNINTKTMVSITEANQNFSKVARLVDAHGSVVILKNNSPKYIILEFDKVEQQCIDNDTLQMISEKLIQKNAKIYEVLAK